MNVWAHMFGTSIGRAQSSLYGAMKSPLCRIVLPCCHGVHETNTSSFMITEFPHLSLTVSRPPYEGSKPLRMKQYHLVCLMFYITNELKVVWQHTECWNDIHINTLPVKTSPAHITSVPRMTPIIHEEFYL